MAWQKKEGSTRAAAAAKSSPSPTACLGEREGRDRISERFEIYLPSTKRRKARRAAKVQSMHGWEGERGGEKVEKEGRERRQSPVFQEKKNVPSPGRSPAHLAHLPSFLPSFHREIGRRREGRKTQREREGKF